jgi:hypothetical protein
MTGWRLELRFDQRHSLLGDLLRFRGDERERIAHIADAFPDPTSTGQS